MGTQPRVDALHVEGVVAVGQKPRRLSHLQAAQANGALAVCAALAATTFGCCLDCDDGQRGDGGRLEAGGCSGVDAAGGDGEAADGEAAAEEESGVDVEDDDEEEDG